MKTFAGSVALGALLVSTAAYAADQRPTAVAFTPAAKAAPATPKVAKRKALQPGVVLPIIAGVAAVGVGVAVASGGSDDDSASPQ